MHTKIIRAALTYAESGKSIFPLHSIKETGECTCNILTCSAPGKHPRISGWALRATTNQDQIKAWFEHYPSSNIGIVTGEKSGLIVIDADNTDVDGVKEYDRLLQEGIVQETYTTETGSKGRHYYYSSKNLPQIIRNYTRVRPGLDIRGEGGYVVAAPSRNSKGDYSVIVERDLRNLPTFPIAFLEVPRANQKQIQVNNFVIKQGRRNSTLFAKAIQHISRGNDYHSALIYTLDQNIRFCKPPLGEDEVQSICRNALSTYLRQKGEAYVKFN